MAGQERQREGGQSTRDIDSLPDPVPSLPVIQGEFLILLK